MGTILPFEKYNVFSPEVADVMGRAFQEAWRYVQLSGSIDAKQYRAQWTRETLARCIIECAQRGERDTDKLRDFALEYLQESAKSAHPSRPP